MEEQQTDSDQSMEEILQSIKRIIADDETSQAEPDKTAADTANDTSSTEITGSDVLELKDIVSEHKNAANAISDTDSKETKASTGNTGEGDSLSALLDAPSDAHDATDTTSKADDVLADIDGLLSEESASASSLALQQLKDATKEADATDTQDHTVQHVAFRSGSTVEDLVVEALKPELKSWLDANLPVIVEKLVKAEIKKITE